MCLLREFVSGWLSRLRQDNPQLAISTEVHRGSHPYLTANYGAELMQLSSSVASVVCSNVGV